MIDADGSGEISLPDLKAALLGNLTQESPTLTEKEVKVIFNSTCVSKNERTIRWHEFIAAVLSYYKFDYRNLNFAFDMLDADHKGYTTFNNFMDFVGNGTGNSGEVLREMWDKALMEAWLADHIYPHRAKARIIYKDFLLLMNCQTKPSQSAMLPTQATTWHFTPVDKYDISQHLECDSAFAMNKEEFNAQTLNLMKATARVSNGKYPRI